RDYAIVMLDPEGRLVSWNTGAERMMGYRADEALGRPYAQLQAPDASAPSSIDVGAQLREAAASGHAESEGELARKDGTSFWANVSITTLYEGERTVRGFAVVMRDITERRMHEDKIARLSRIHAVLSGINAAIVRIREREELF